MNLVVYADFTSPECYLANRRVDALGAAGVVVEWRAVEGAPLLPVAGRRLAAEEQSAFAERFRALDRLLLPEETLPWSMPTIVPKTQAAVSAYAEADAGGVGDDVRRLLFELYWLSGREIGSPTVLRTPLTGPMLRARSQAAPLRESGYAVNVDRGPITTAACLEPRATSPVRVHAHRGTARATASTCTTKTTRRAGSRGARTPASPGRPTDSRSAASPR